MANSPSAIKRARQSEGRRQHNVALRSRMRTAVKKVVKTVASQDAAQAAEAYKVAVPELDSMVRKGIIHANKAARHKSRLNKAIKALSAAS